MKCFLFGHRPYRFINTYFVVCQRCDKHFRMTVVTRFHDLEGRPCGGNYTRCDGARFVFAGQSQEFAGREHLSRRCDNCLYAWATPTLEPSASTTSAGPK